MTNVEREPLQKSMPVAGLDEDRIAAGLRRVAPAAHAEVVCSKCQWKCLLPSRRRTGLDFFLALFLLRPYRCRSCHRRYYRLSFSNWQPFRPSWPNPSWPNPSWPNPSWPKKTRPALNANKHPKRTDSAA
jgi:hypothetical protein